MKLQNFTTFVAMRYLRRAEGSAKGRRFLRFITYLSIGGVAVGVAALLLTLAIVRGFSNEIKQKIVAFESHLQIDSYSSDQPLGQADRLMSLIQRQPEVRKVSPMVYDFVMLKARGEANIEGILVRGVPEAPSFLAKTIRQGTFSLKANAEGLPAVVIGQGLANLMKVKVGDKVTIFSQQKPFAPELAKTPLGVQPSEAAPDVASETAPETTTETAPEITQCYIAGVFDSGMREFEEAFLYMDIAEARKLFGFAPDQVSRLDVMLSDLDESREVATRLEHDFGLSSRFAYPIRARSVYQAQDGLFAWTKLQEQIIPILIGVIVIVAAFNLVSMLLMMILEKTNEIGILQSMGASPRKIRRLFLWLGLMIGVVGSLIGVFLAFTFGTLQQQFHLIPLPVESYFMDSAPILMKGMDFLIVPFFALVLCLFASYLPARFAAKIDPIHTIRFKG
jgi:lipoprotein-releasing system permease protein